MFVVQSATGAAVAMGMERRQWWPMVEWVKRERLREGRRLRTMGGGVGGRRVRSGWANKKLGHIKINKKI